MALYTLADLPLAADVAKPMDIFGGRWQGHTEKIIKNWRALVAPEDTIVLGGDISWGINLAEAKGDFALIDSLPGKKIILKGNHDLWWETASKMHRFLDENGFTTSYGSFFDDHDVKVQVFPYDKEGDESSYLVNDTIKAGDVRAVEPVQ